MICTLPPETARGLDEECIFSNDTVEDCTERRLYRCPLVEILTPHGRLIDADELAKDKINLYGTTDVVLMVDIENAPTIIEAEVSE